MNRFIIALILALFIPVIAFAEGEFPRKNYQSIWNFPEQFQTKIDYAGRTDDNPVYIGKSSRGSSTSEKNWVIYLITYDVSNRIDTIQVATGAWDSRTDLTYE